MFACGPSRKSHKEKENNDDDRNSNAKGGSVYFPEAYHIIKMREMQ